MTRRTSPTLTVPPSTSVRHDRPSGEPSRALGSEPASGPRMLTGPLRFTDAVMKADLGPRSATMRAVLNVIATMADFDDATCWPSVGTLAERAGCSPSTVHVQLAKAERLGYISRIRQGGGPQGRTNVYLLNVGKLESLCACRCPNRPVDTPPPPMAGSSVASADRKDSVPFIHGCRTSSCRRPGVRIPEARPPAFGDEHTSEQTIRTEAPALKRPDQQDKMQRDQACDPRVQWSAGARAQADQRRLSWRVAKSLQMLFSAFGTWARSGLTNAPATLVADLARGPHSSPARVEFVIRRADETVATARSQGTSCNPVGVVIAGLAMQRDKPDVRPWDVPTDVEAKWNQLETSECRLWELRSGFRALDAAIGAPQNAVRAGNPVGQ